jgi:hypothetical protein
VPVLVAHDLEQAASAGLCLYPGSFAPLVVSAASPLVFGSGGGLYPSAEAWSSAYSVPFSSAASLTPAHGPILPCACAAPRRFA